MWFRISSVLLLSALSSVIFAKPLNLPGDMLSAGEQFASTRITMSDWYNSADFIGDSTPIPIDDTQRAFSDANHKGYGFSTQLTYVLGLSEDINLGLRYGYRYEKNEASIDSAAAAEIEGDWINEGGTDLTLLGRYRLHSGTSVDVEFQMPICSASSFSSLCTSNLAVPENSQQTGRDGGQGDGYYRLKTGVASNWVTEMDTHWLGDAYMAITLADDVFGEKVSSPFVFGASFGGIFQLEKNHQWVGKLSVQRMLEYSGYSEQLQTQVNYAQQSQVAFDFEYLWDFLGPLQLRPFAQLAIVQLPTQSFYVNNKKRSLEYTAGTQVTLGAEIRASF